MASGLDLAAQALVKGSKLFQFLDDAGRERLVRVARPETYQKGEVVVREGEISGSFYVIVKGQVSVDMDDGGVAKRLASLGEGMFFGEMAALMKQPRSATVTALSELELLAFDPEPVEAILQDYPKLRELLG